MESESSTAYAGSLARVDWLDGRDSLSQLIRDYKRITAKMAAYTGTKFLRPSPAP